MSCGQFESERRHNRLMNAAFTIQPVRRAADVAELRTLFAAYAATPGVAVCVQGFDGEIAALPGAYAEPRGTLLLARVGPAAAGCAALKPIDGSIGELKRLFVREEFRARSIGAALATAIIDGARTRGYARLRLDTLPSMKAARALYARLGFTEIPPPEGAAAGVDYFELVL